MEFNETWKEKVTPLGIAYWEHTASARRISDNACTGWPTPDVHHHGTAADPLAKTRPSGAKRQLVLQDAAWLVGWNTPRVTDGSNGGPNQAGGALPADAALAAWATPAARDYKSGETADGKPLTHNARPLSEMALGAITTSSPASASRGVLDAAFSRWLMGCPESWDRCSPGWNEWDAIQKLLSEPYETTEDVWRRLAETAWADYVAMEMQ
jgi:hypothetical protein